MFPGGSLGMKLNFHGILGVPRGLSRKKYFLQTILGGVLGKLYMTIITLLRCH
jgi:hypothetical protein